MRCPHCQADNPDENVTCQNCGRALTPDPTANPQPDPLDPEEPEEEGGVRVGLGVLAIVLLAAALVVAGVLLFTRQQRQREMAAEATVVAIAARSTATAQAELAIELEATAIAQATAVAEATAAYAPTATYEALEIRYRRGVAALEMGDYATAVEEFRAVLAVDPNFLDAEARLQQALLALTPAAEPAAPETPTPADDATPVPIRPTDTPTSVAPAATPTVETPAPGATPTPTWTIVPPAFTPTWTPIPPTATWTPIPGAIATATPTWTATWTPTAIPPTATNTPPPTVTPTALTPTTTPTPTPTPTPTEDDLDPAADTPTPLPTDTATPTVTPTVTPTMTATATEEPTPTMTATATMTASPTLTPTETATVTPTSTSSPTMTPTSTSTVTPTMTPTMTPTTTMTPTSTMTPTLTATPTLTVTVTPTGTITPTTPVATVIATATLTIPLPPANSVTPTPESDALEPGDAEQTVTLAQTEAVANSAVLPVHDVRAAAHGPEILRIALPFIDEGWHRELSAALGRIEQTNPHLEIVYDIYPLATYWQDVQAGPPPDVMFLLRTGSAADDLGAYLTPITDWYATRSDGPDAATGPEWAALEEWRVDGHLYGLPILWVHAPVVLLDGDLLAAADLPYPDPGWTWHDLHAYAAALAARSNLEKPIYLGEETLALWTGSLVYSGLTGNVDTGCILDDDGARAALQFMADFAQHERVALGSSIALPEGGGRGDAFPAPDAAIRLTTLPVALRLTSDDAKWLVAPLPVTSGASSYFMASSFGVGIFRGAENVAGAQQLLTFLAAEPQRLHAQGALPVLPPHTAGASPGSDENLAALAQRGYLTLLNQLAEHSIPITALHTSRNPASGALAALVEFVTGRMTQPAAINLACVHLHEYDEPIPTTRAGRSSTDTSTDAP